MSRKRGRSVQVVQVTQADGAIQEADSQQVVEEAIWDNIHGKCFYLAEQVPICQGRLRGDFGYMANTPAGKAVLDGRYVKPAGMDEGTAVLLDEIMHLHQEVPVDSVDTMIWQSRWNQ